MKKPHPKAMRFAVAAIAIIGAGYFLLPSVSCGGSDDEQLAADPVVTAAGAGDLGAIHTLYEHAKATGLPRLAAEWALEGALHADAQMRQVYVDYFRTSVTDQDRELVLNRLRRSSDKPGAACLLATLTESPAQQARCSQ